MYAHDMRQLSFSEFILPFEGKLDGRNRWVRLAELVPWQRFEKQYASLFSPGQGALAKPFRMALAAFHIDAKIAKTQRIIELQKEYRTVLISEVVTGKIKVPELSIQETTI